MSNIFCNFAFQKNHLIEPLCKGIDIYEEEHKKDASGNYLPIDWEGIKAQGYDFVILKVGSDVSGKSPTFDMDYEGAKAAGLGVGAYYYAYSSTVSGTRGDAQEVLEWIKGKQFEYPIYYDIEESYLSTNLSQDSLTELTPSPAGEGKIYHKPSLARAVFCRAGACSRR